MKEIELIQAYGNSFPVRELRKMLGIKKTDSYWILKNRDIQTVTINGKMRILTDSFWNWYRNQTKYHIIDGPEPGESLKATSYSVHDIMTLLDISEYIAYTLISKNIFDIIKVDYQMRITKESFERWYPTQEKYRLAEDRAADSEIILKTYSIPDIRKLLGVHRNMVYSIIKHYENDFEVITVSGQKRITIESFNRWYASQSKYKITEDTVSNDEPDKFDISAEIEENTDNAADTVVLLEAQPEKEIYRLEDLMTMLKISRKAAYKLIQTGELLAIKAGKAYLIPASEYQRFIGRSKNNGINHSEE